MALARDVVVAWNELNDAEKLDFLAFLEAEMSPDQAKIETAVAAYHKEPTLDNYRTLCIPCHREETRALAQRRARRRRETAMPLLAETRSDPAREWKRSRARKALEAR